MPVPPAPRVLLALRVLPARQALPVPAVLDQLVPLVRPAPPVQPDLLAYRVMLVPLAQPAPQVQPDLLVPLDQQVLQENQPRGGLLHPTLPMVFLLMPLPVTII